MNEKGNSNKIINCTVFLFISIINLLILYMIPKYTPEWDKHSIQFVEFIYFLIISLFVFLFFNYKFYHKYGSGAVIEVCYSTLFYVLLLGLVPSVFWWLQYNVESNIYSLERKFALVFVLASYSLCFSTAFIGLSAVWLNDYKNKKIAFRVKMFFFLLLFFSSLFLSVIYVTHMFRG